MSKHLDIFSELNKYAQKHSSIFDLQEFSDLSQVLNFIENFDLHLDKTVVSLAKAQQETTDVFEFLSALVTDTFSDSWLSDLLEKTDLSDVFEELRPKIVDIFNTKKEQNTEKSNKLEALMKEKEELSSQLESVNKALQSSSSDEIVAELQSQITTLKNEKTESEETHQHLTDKLYKKEKQISELEESNEHLIAKIYKRETQINDLESTVEELKKKVSSSSDSSKINSTILSLVHLLKQ